MYERFTDRARKIMQLANQEAQQLGDEHISSEHILLGLTIAGGVADTVLKNLHVDLGKVRQDVENRVQSGHGNVAIAKRPVAPRAKKIIEYAMEESSGFNHGYVGSEHILLGLLCEREGIAAVVLNNCGVTLEAARAETLALLGPGMANPSNSKGTDRVQLEGERTRLETEAMARGAPKTPSACPHCGRPYRTRWSLLPGKLLRRLFGR